MLRYVVCMIFVAGCSGKSDADHPVPQDSPSTTSRQPVVHDDRLKEYLITADSVILLSHHSPNMPITNPETGEDYPRRIPFIEDGEINYAISVQERKQLKKTDINELVEILALHAVDDGAYALCFQPRNAVVAFTKEKMACFDFCFDCFGVARYGDFGSELIMDGNKYEKLIAFYKKHGFRYEME